MTPKRLDMEGYVQRKTAGYNAVEKKASAYGYGNYGYYQYEYKSDKK